MELTLLYGINSQCFTITNNIHGYKTRQEYNKTRVWSAFVSHHTYFGLVLWTEIVIFNRFWFFFLLYKRWKWITSYHWMPVKTFLSVQIACIRCIICMNPCDWPRPVDLLLKPQWVIFRILESLFFPMNWFALLQYFFHTLHSVHWKAFFAGSRSQSHPLNWTSIWQPLN